MPVAAPKHAPADAPKRSGDTMGFLKMPWNAQPAPDSAAPMISAAATRGSLMVKNTLTSASLTSAPVKGAVKNASTWPKSKSYRPRESESAQLATRATQSTASVSTRRLCTAAAPSAARRPAARADAPSPVTSAGRASAPVPTAPAPPAPASPTAPTATTARSPSSGALMPLPPHPAQDRTSRLPRRAPPRPSDRSSARRAPPAPSASPCRLGPLR